IIGITTDVPVSALATAVPFYTTVLGRPADLTPDDRTAEWILSKSPEIAFRLIEARPGEAPRGTVRVGLGVAGVDAERVRLTGEIADLPEVRRRPGVIALLELRDPDGNRVVIWHDLLTR